MTVSRPCPTRDGFVPDPWDKLCDLKSGTYGICPTVPRSIDGTRGTKLHPDPAEQSLRALKGTVGTSGTNGTEHTALVAARDRARMQVDLAVETLQAIELALGIQQPVLAAAPGGQVGHSDLIAPCEAAERFGVDSSTIRRWARQSGIGQRQGGRWRISVERLKQHLASLR